MRILFVCRFLPHPGARDSGSLDIYHHIRSLARRHRIGLIGFSPPGDHGAAEAMSAYCERVEAVPYSSTAVAARLWRAGWRLLLPRVYGRTVSISYTRRLQQFAETWAPDVAVIDGMMARYHRALPPTVVTVLDQVDIYGTVAYHDYLRSPPGPGRWWAGFDWLRTHAAELSLARACGGVVTRSEKDRRFLQELLPEQTIGLLMPWFEGLAQLQQIPIEQPGTRRLLFVGAMQNPKNQDAAIYFANQIWPRVRERVPDATFWIVGDSPNRAVRSLGDRDGITVTGGVPDLFPYYRDAAVNVVPLRTGGGLITKTLNGMAAARPTVATTAGNSGTGARHGRHLLVADVPAAFADAAAMLLLDADRWRELAAAGRAFVREQYNWDEIAAQFEQFLLLLRNEG